MLYLTVKIFLKQKILNKLLLNKRNKRKPKNQKNKITTKIEVRAVYLLAKPALPLTGLSKNSTALAKYIVDLHTPSRDAILSLAEKKIDKQNNWRNF